MDEQTHIVRDGYDRLAPTFSPSCFGTPDETYHPWLESVTAGLERGSRVLDLGCGNGRPAAAWLAQHGFRVIGVDVSPAQLRLARAAVPEAEFVEGDLAAVTFEPASFDAAVAFYSIIHVPLAMQPELFARIAGWLRPSGRFATTLGHESWTGVEHDWLGVEGVTMRWSHADAGTYRRWLEDAGLEVLEQGFVPEGDGGHELFLARRPA